MRKSVIEILAKIFSIRFVKNNTLTDYQMFPEFFTENLRSNKFTEYKPTVAPLRRSSMNGFFKVSSNYWLYKDCYNKYCLVDGE